LLWYDAAPRLNLNNLFIGAVAGQVIIEAAMQHAIKGLQKAMRNGSKPGILGAIGRGALTQGSQQLLSSSTASQEAVPRGIRIVLGQATFSLSPGQSRCLIPIRIESDTPRRRVDEIHLSSLSAGVPPCGGRAKVDFINPTISSNSGEESPRQRWLVLQEHGRGSLAAA
jgi:hypothetical protein